LFRFALIRYDILMTTIALPSDVLTEKDLLAEADLASLLQQSNDFERWGEPSLPNKEDLERDLQQVISSLSDHIGDRSRPWDLGTHAQGSRSTTMERSYSCLACVRRFQVTGCLPQAEVTGGDIEVVVNCPFCDELNIVLWPKADKFPKVSQE
jgi:hypothetical protein